MTETASIEELSTTDPGAEAQALARTAVQTIRDICLKVSGVQVAEPAGGGSSGRSKKSPRSSAKTKGKKPTKSKPKKDIPGEANSEVLDDVAHMSEPWGTPDVFIVFGNYPLIRLSVLIHNC